MKPTSKAASKKHTEKSSARSSPRNSNRKQTEESLREDQGILANAEEVAKMGSWKWDLRTQKVTWSDEMFRLFGVEREGFDGDVNRVIAERIHPDDIAAVTESNRSVLEDANPIPLSYRILLPDGTERTVWAQGKLIRDETGNTIALTGYVQDITEHVHAERKILQLKRLYATLSQVNQMIVRVKNRDELFQTICDVAVKFGEFKLAWVGILDEVSGKVQPVAANGLDVKQWTFPIVNLHQEQPGDSLIPEAIRTSKVTISENIQNDVRTQSFSKHLQNYPYHVAAVIPFRLRNKTIGILGLFSQEQGIFQDEDEVHLLEEMGLDISFALDTMENEKERRQVENDLRLNEEKFSKAFLSSPTALLITRLSDGQFIEVNDAYCATVGYARDELIGHKTTEFNIYINAADRQAIVEQLLAKGSVRNFETVIRHRSGENRYVVAGQEMITFNNEACILSNILDRTERKLAEEQILSLSKFPGENPNSILRISQEGVLLYANQSSRPLLNLWECEVGSQLPTELVEAALTVLQNGTSKEIEINCEDRVYSINLAPVASAGYVNGYGRDVTESKHAVERLRKSEERFRLLFENNYSVMLLIEPQSGMIKNANQAAAEFYGYSVAELCAMNINDINRLTAEEVYAERMSAVKEERNYFNFQHRLSNGEVRPVEVYSSPMEADGNILLFSIVNDITERVRAEKKILQLKRLYATLSQVNQMIVRVADRDELFQTICDIALAFGEFSVSWIGLLDENSGNVPPLFASGMDIKTWPLPIVNIQSGPLSKGLVARALHTSKVTISEDVQADQHLQILHNPLREQGFHSSAVIPLRLRGKSIGALTLLSRETGLFQDMDEVHLLEEMGLDISFALDNMEKEKQRRQTEEALRQSEERFSTAFFTSPVSQSIITQKTNEIMAVNDACCHLFGYSREELIGASTANLLLWGNHTDRLSAVEELQRTGRLLPREATIRVKSGESRTVIVAIESISWKGFPCLISSVFDITERKQAEEALKQSEHILRLFVEHSPASIAMFDRDMRYIVASNRYLIDYDLPPQELTGRSHYDVFSEIPERWKEIHRRCLAGAVEKAEEDPFPRISGKLDWVRWEIRPWYKEPEKIGGIILFSEVITERKQIQDELHQLNAELEQRVLQRTMELLQANRAKDEFLANMSHELRTPLNTVLGLSESLLEQRRGPLNEKQVQSIELISSSGQHLLGLINDILEVSKIEAGKLQLNPSPISLKELCESSLNFIRELALKKQIAVEFINETSISRFNADPQRLKQILINLLNNAVKFTPEKGRVSLQVSTNMEENRILFSITDTGIGIAAEDLKKLFTPFTQLDSSLSRQYAGTGLGLALVKKLTELHGGSIEVESKVGQGSRFAIILPLSQSVNEQISETTVDATKIEPKFASGSTASKELGTILLAEDNMINSEMVSEYLIARGYYVVTAKNGIEVLEKAAEFMPDLILMDIQMPKMDGLQATRLLRSDPRFLSTPIVALTALAMPGDKERCLEAGVNEYLSKPVSLKMLLEHILNLVHPNKQAH